MNILVIYAHPNPASFNYAMLQAFTQEARAQGHEVDVCDLYAVEFQCVLGGRELADLKKGIVASDVLEQQRRVRWAHLLVFIYPIWWYDRPALLKGWFDRVFTQGFAFESGPKGIVGLLKDKKGLVLQTAGAPPSESTQLEPIAHGAMSEGTLRFCGMEKVVCKTFYSVPSSKEDQRQQFLDQVRHLAASLS
jgi:NAD(P)H dehydrogenase (quinone)